MLSISYYWQLELLAPQDAEGHDLRSRVRFPPNDFTVTSTHILQDYGHGYS
jgi:hypothetical protein